LHHDRRDVAMIEVRRLGPQIGAEIHGVDVRKLDDAGFAAIYRAWLDSNVLVVPVSSSRSRISSAIAAGSGSCTRIRRR